MSIVQLRPSAPRDGRVGERDVDRSVVEQWPRLGGVSGMVAMAAFIAVAASPATAPQAAIVASVFGPALACTSLGLYHVLRLRRWTISGDLGVVANLAAGVAVTLMLLAQVGLLQHFEAEFGAGAADSADRTLHAAFEAANGVQLGLDVAWDVFIGLGTILLAVNMWNHPRFGRVLAGVGIAIAVPFLVLNLTLFPDNPGDAGAIDLGPVLGLWYLFVSVRLAQCGRWVAEQLADRGHTGAG